MQRSMKHWGESFSQGARLLRVVDHDGREQVLSIRVGDATGWTATKISPGGDAEDVALRRRELRIGRDHSADLVLNDPHLAGQHCRIFERDGNLVLVDRGTAIGTHVNGRRCVEPTVLADGDRVEFGRSLIEVMPGRAQLDIRRIDGQIRHQPTAWTSSDDELRAAFYRELQRHAQLWRERGRPRSRLLGVERLERALDLSPSIVIDAEVEALVSASVRLRRRRQAARWLIAGMIPGLALAALIIQPLFPASSPTERREVPGSATPIQESTKPSPEGPRCTDLDHEVIEIDTLEALESYYRVSHRELLELNRAVISAGAPLQAGMILKVCTTMPRWEREKIVHTVRSGETLESIAQLYHASVPSIREQIPQGAIEPDQQLRLWVPRRTTRPTAFDPAPLVLPSDATSLGTPQMGTLANPVKVPAGEAYDVRCPAHSYASHHTTASLDAAIRRLRRAYGYTGQIMVADLSLADGGHYGNHVSHQSGRDADLWLPILGGVYRRGCDIHCGNTWCRPEPEEADWRATWQLISALLESDSVEKIFIDKSLMPLLREGARQQGTAEAVIKRMIRPSRAPVMHSPAHTHHIHVRFRCAPGEDGCIQQ